MTVLYYVIVIYHRCEGCMVFITPKPEGMRHTRDEEQ